MRELIDRLERGLSGQAHSLFIPFATISTALGLIPDRSVLKNGTPTDPRESTCPTQCNMAGSRYDCFPRIPGFYRTVVPYRADRADRADRSSLKSRDRKYCIITAELVG